MELFGYPQDADGTGKALRQYISVGKVTSCKERYFDFSGIISGGMSGGPVMRTDVNNIVGVVSKKYDGKDLGIGWRMTDTVMNKIIELRNAE